MLEIDGEFFGMHPESGHTFERIFKWIGLSLKQRGRTIDGGEGETVLVNKISQMRTIPIALNSHTLYNPFHFVEEFKIFNQFVR